jgi:cyclohexa-1,5-dienecarbonyl-CoA hydratase
MMEATEKIQQKTSHDGQVAELTLCAPKGNVLDRQMMAELTRAIAATAARDEVKALVFRGEGSHFSFGASVEEHRKELVPEMLDTFHGLLRSLIESGKPALALVQGQCLGGGLELVSLCHWIFAAPAARFGQPEINLAVFAPAASLILPHRVGQSAADDLLLSGRSITAEEACRIGLVHEVAEDPSAALDEHLVRHLLPKSATALRFAARASRHEMHRAFLENIGSLESTYVRELMETRDANEGIQAFLDKRPAVWENR